MMRNLRNNKNALGSINDNEIDTNNLKKVQLEILKSFIEICCSQKLQYFLTGGTALGAIRHSGFIPWDDDIDICMPRSHYEIFLKKAQALLPSCYFLQTYLTDPDYRQPFAKIRATNTTYVETPAQFLNINHGVYIDIFPVDGLPNNEKRINRMLFFKKIVLLMCGKDYFPSSKKRNFQAFLCGLLIGTWNSQKALLKLDRKCMKYPFESSELTYIYGGVWGKKEIHLRERYGNGIIKRFENLDVVVPEQFDEYLTEQYGDYMTFPPVEKRHGHHYCCIFDLNKSYKEYMK